jgi:hypothetical protein
VIKGLFSMSNNEGDFFNSCTLKITDMLHCGFFFHSLSNFDDNLEKQLFDCLLNLQFRKNSKTFDEIFFNKVLRFKRKGFKVARTCSTYDQFLSLGRLLTDKLTLLGRSIGDAYSSSVPDPTSGISGDLCQPIYFSER